MLRLIALIFLYFCVSACEIINPDEEIPAYLTVLKPKLIMPNGDTSTTAVRDVWVYQTGTYIGTFETPARFPVLHLKDNSYYLFDGGIAENTFSGSRRSYPFWMLDTFKTKMESNKDYTFQPTFKYYSDSLLKFRVKEDFEQLGTQFEYCGSEVYDTARITKINEIGNTIGAVFFDKDSMEFCAGSINPFIFPRGKSDLFAEITYRSSVYFFVGIIINNSAQPIIQLKPTSDWKTEYINLAFLANSAAENAQLRLLLRSIQTQKGGYIYLDNIRFIHLNI